MAARVAAMQPGLLRAGATAGRGWPLPVTGRRRDQLQAVQAVAV